MCKDLEDYDADPPEDIEDCEYRSGHACGLQMECEDCPLYEEE
jgi:hypothetical protein